MNFSWRAALKRQLGPALLGLLLLLAQAGFLTHGLTHALDNGHIDDPACEACLAYAPMGGALVSVPLDIEVFSRPGPLEAKPLRQPLSVAGPLPYRSRAPPSPLV